MPRHECTICGRLVPVADLRDLFNAAGWPRLFYFLFGKLLAKFIFRDDLDPKLLGLVELAAC